MFRCDLPLLIKGICVYREWEGEYGFVGRNGVSLRTSAAYVRGILSRAGTGRFPMKPASGFLTQGQGVPRSPNVIHRWCAAFPGTLPVVSPGGPSALGSGGELWGVNGPRHLPVTPGLPVTALFLSSAETRLLCHGQSQTVCQRDSTHSMTVTPSRTAVSAVPYTDRSHATGATW